MQLVIAAMTTDPSVTSAPFEEASGNASRKFSETSLSNTRSCGRFGPAILGFYITEIELKSIRVLRVVAIGWSEIVGRGIRLDKRHGLLGASSASQVVDRLLVNREETTRRAVLRSHVSDRRTIGDWQ